MHIEELRTYCLSKPEVSESFPFDSNTLVFKVVDKLFALTSLSSEEFRVNLKCNPELAVALRENHNCVIPGFHMNKKHWNTILIDGSVSDEQIKEWIDHSYDQVILNLPKKHRERLSTP